MMTISGCFRALRLLEVRKNVYVCFQLPAELVEMLVADTELLKKVPERPEVLRYKELIVPDKWREI